MLDQKRSHSARERTQKRKKRDSEDNDLTSRCPLCSPNSDEPCPYEANVVAEVAKTTGRVIYANLTSNNLVTLDTLQAAITYHLSIDVNKLCSAAFVRFTIQNQLKHNRDSFQMFLGARGMGVDHFAIRVLEQQQRLREAASMDACCNMEQVYFLRQTKLVREGHIDSEVKLITPRLLITSNGTEFKWSKTLHVFSHPKTKIQHLATSAHVFWTETVTSLLFSHYQHCCRNKAALAKKTKKQKQRKALSHVFAHPNFEKGLISHIMSFLR